MDGVANGSLLVVTADLPFDQIDHAFGDIGGVIDQSLRPSVDKGIQEARLKGILAGFPVVDFSAEAYDGSYHSVDSSDIAFKLAGSVAFRTVSKTAGPTLLEPIIEVSVTTPDEFMGDVTGDITSRRGKIMGMDAVYIHIADKYYIPEADWSDPEFITKLKERVDKSKPTLIGTKATDIQLVEVHSDHFIQSLENEDLKKNPYVGKFFQLYDVDAKYTILYFWEADCGHCKVATPELYEAYKRLKTKGIEVVAVNTLSGEEGKIKWINYINENGFYDWVNCWNPYDFTYKNIYDIMTTPQLFVLNSDKEIVAKRIAPEQAEKIIESMLSNE